jgi:beta-mannosidase
MERRKKGTKFSLGTILINGNEVGKTENMFRGYSFDVKSALQAGSNTIVVKYVSLLQRIF